MGDGIQAAKAGILEIGDLYVINKADRDGADQVRRDLRGMLALAERADGAWKPPIVKTVASKGEGIDEVVAEIDRHRAWLESSGELATRRTRRARDEIEAIAVTALRATVGRRPRPLGARRPGRAGSPPGSPIPTPRPTSCSRTCSRTHFASKPGRASRRCAVWFGTNDP